MTYAHERYPNGDFPKDYKANTAWRKQLYTEAHANEAVQRAIIDRCREDILFFLNGFVFIFEPRAKKTGEKLGETKIPFATWAHQDSHILTFKEAIEEQFDVAVEKSRGEGATWMVLMVFLHQWLFRREFVSFGIVSRNEQASDNPKDPNSLGWKLDFALANLPRWMCYLERSKKPATGPATKFERSVRDHTWSNRNTGSTITAHTTTGDLARGGRNTAFLLDEMASFRPGEDDAVMSSMVEVTDCVLMVSTPQGPRGAYYKAMKQAKSEQLIRYLRIHWTDNESRNRGLYHIGEGGFPVAEDPENNPLPPGYADLFCRRYKKALLDRGFDITKGVRSPWYDGRCLRPRMTPKFISQEYDIDYEGTKSKFFPVGMIERLMEETTAPLHVGEIDFNHEDIRPMWREVDSGHLLLWISLSAANAPMQGVKYLVSADISNGQGGEMGSSSALSIVEYDTGLKVGEFATPEQPPELFAKQAVAICRWFHNAQLVWEVNGPGKAFGNELERIGYSNIWYREIMEVWGNQKTKKPGWHTNIHNKSALLSNYSYGLGAGLFVNRSYIALEECIGYEDLGRGRIEHTAALEADPSGAGENHGDRTIADAIAFWVLSKTSPKRRQSDGRARPETAPVGSFAWRQQMARKEAKRKRKGMWSDRIRNRVSGTAGFRND